MSDVGNLLGDTGGPVGAAEIKSPAAEEAQSRSHVFADPRQARIHDRLTNVGPGPAGFFRDACFLVDHPQLLLMTAHMVGHALRETESALRDVLCETFDVHLPDQKDKHRAEIAALLAALGLPAADAAAQAWLDLPSKTSGLQAWAHRRHLGRRVLDDEFRRMWDLVLLFLDVVLERFEREAARAFALSDQLVVRPPTAGAVASAMGRLIKGVAVMDHFARAVPLRWFEPLADAGFFEGVPSIDDLPDAATWDGLRWPNVQLLRRAAADPALRDRAWTVIEAVAAVANPPIHVELIEIALASEPAFAARLVPFARRWISEEGGFLLSDRIAQLAQLLTEAGDTEAGFSLAEALLELPADRAET